MNRSQISELFNVNPSTVSRWRSSGCPCENGEYDPDLVRSWLRAEGNRKPSDQLAAHDRILDGMCELFENRIDLAVLGGIIAADPRHLAGDRLILWDLCETLRICREPGSGEFRYGVELLGRIVEILRGEVGQYQTVLDGAEASDDQP